MKEECLSIRGIDRAVWRQFKAKCAILGVPVGLRINRILVQDIEKEPCFEDIEKEVSWKK